MRSVLYFQHVGWWWCSVDKGEHNRRAALSEASLAYILYIFIITYIIYTYTYRSLQPELHNFNLNKILIFNNIIIIIIYNNGNANKQVV